MAVIVELSAQKGFTWWWVVVEFSWASLHVRSSERVAAAVGARDSFARFTWRERQGPVAK